MSWDRNNLAPHALPSFLCDSLSSSSAGLNLGRHLGQSGPFPMVAGNGPNTSIAFFGSWVRLRVRTNFWTLQARLREVSSRILGLLSTYCTVHMRLFFIFWICSNIFCDFSGCRCQIIQLQTLMKIQRKENRKLKTMSPLFLIFWIRSNIFRNFSGCRSPIFNCLDLSFH